MFEALHGDPLAADRFATAQLVGALEAFSGGKLLPTELARSGKGVAPGGHARVNNRIRGLAPVRSECAVSELTGPRRFSDAHEETAFQWYGPETDANGRPYRWSGPSRRSALELPIRLDAPARIRVQVVHPPHPAVYDSLAIQIAGEPIAFARAQDGESGFLTFDLEPAALEPPGPSVLIELSFDHLVTPHDLSAADPSLPGEGDKRWLGMGVGWVEIAARAAPAGW